MGNSTSFTYSALVTAVFTLPAQYRAGASFIVNDSTARNLYSMLDSQEQAAVERQPRPPTAPTRSSDIRSTRTRTFRHRLSRRSALLFGNWSRAYMIRRVDGSICSGSRSSTRTPARLVSAAGKGWTARWLLAAAGIALKHSAT